MLTILRGKTITVGWQVRMPKIDAQSFFYQKQIAIVEDLKAIATGNKVLIPNTGEHSYLFISMP